MGEGRLPEGSLAMLVGLAWDTLAINRKMLA